MKPLHIFLVLLGLGLLPCQAAPSVPIMPPSELRVGMHGYGRTVFHGTHVESFPVTILGVVRHFLAEQDLILFKIDSGYLKQRGLGIVAGMSGSPVYVNGRLIGAIAYGWSFAKAPVGGITPITAMLTDLPGASGVDTAAPTARRQLDQPLHVDGHTFHYIALQSVRQSAQDSPDTLALRPATGVLETRGWSARGLSHLQSLLGGLDLTPVSTMSVDSDDLHHPLAPVQPGASVGVELVSGDLEVAATGTLTYVDGKRFLAFGHPLAQLGDVHIPLTEAYVYNIYPSAQSPFKLAGQLGEIGELSSDRSYAVGGTLGVRAPTIPVAIHVTDPAHHLNKTLHVRVFDHPLMSAQLISSAAADALHADTSTLGSAVAHLHYEVDTGDGQTVSIHTTQSSVDIEDTVQADVASVLGKLSTNEFQSNPVRGLHLEISLSPGRRTAVIQRVFTDRSEYAPGDTMVVGVQLKPYNQPSVVKEFTVPVPADIDRGVVKLAVSGGAELPAVRKKLAIPEPTPTSLADVYHELTATETSDQLVLTVQYTSNGALVGAQRYSFLPTSMQGLAAAVNSSALLPDKDIYVEHQELPWVIGGSQILGIGVDVKDNTGYKPVTVEATQGRTATPTPSPSASPMLRTVVPAPTPSGGPDARVLPSSARRWLLSDAGFLQRGDLQSVRVSEAGTLALGPETRVQDGPAQEVGWTVASRGQTTAIGYGPPARVSVRRGGDSVQQELPGTAVTALAVDQHGTVWAATCRPGRVYRLVAGHAAEAVLSTETQYVWALAVADNGDVYVGCGRPGRIYRVRDGHATHWGDTLESHVRSLAVAADGTLYVGTGNRGAIYSGRDGQLHPLYSTDYGSVDGLALQDGDLWAASGKSVYRINLSDHRVETIDLHTGPILSMAASGDRLYAGTLDGRLYQVTADGSDLLIDGKTGPLMAVAATDGAVLALHSSPPVLSELSARVAPAGRWDSPVLDATAMARWGTVRWEQEAPPGATVSISSRSGDTAEPDDSWQPWVATTTTNGAAQMVSEPGRYLQVRVAMTATTASPTVSGLTIYYRLTGVVPHLAISEPGPGESWSGKHKIVWKCDRGNRDELIYDVEASADEGKTWRPVELHHPPVLREHPLAPDEKPAPPPEDSVEWNTSNEPDGVYRIRITAWTVGTHDSEAFMAPPVVVVNHPPTIDVLHVKIENGQVQLDGVAHARLNPVLEVAYRLDNGDWHLAQPANGLFDAPDQPFWLAEPFTTKPTTIELRATDEAGNVQTLKRSL